MAAENQSDDPLETLADLVEGYRSLVDAGRELSLLEYCGGDQPLADRLAKELRSLEQMDRLLQSSTSNETETPDSSAKTARTDGEKSSVLGQRIGLRGCESDFELIKFVANGGCSEVYQAKETKLGRLVALKFLRPEFEHSEYHLARFQREVAITSRLDHPGVIAVHALGGSDRAAPFYVMPFIEGGTLRELADRFHLEGHSFDSTRGRALLGHFVDVCQTVAHAHTREILHRDLKPDNVIVGRFGETYVVDWGLAKQLRHEEKVGDPGAVNSLSTDEFVDDLTLQGNILGSPAFLSPEQARGADATMRSDVFGLGSTLYYLLSGNAAFRGRSLPEVLHHARHNEFEPLTKVGRSGGLPKPLIAIQRRCMNGDPQERYANAGEVAEEVERFLAGDRVRTHVESMIERAQRGAKKNRKPLAVVAVAGVLLLLVLSVSTWLLGRSNAELAKREFEAVELRERAEESLSVAQESLYLQSISLAEAELRNCNLARAETLLSQCSLESRNLEWYLLRSMVDQNRPSAIFAPERWFLCFDIASDGSRLAVFDSQRVLQVFQIEKGALDGGLSRDSFVRLFDLSTKMHVEGMAFNPNGTRLITYGYRMVESNEPVGSRRRATLELWDVESGTRVAARDASGPIEVDATWSEDGTRIASCGLSGSLRIRDAETLLPTARMKDQEAELTGISFVNGSNDQVVSASESGWLRTWSADGSLLTQVQAHPGGIVDLCTRSDQIVVAGGDRIVSQWKFDDARFKRECGFAGHQDLIKSVAITANGRYYCSAGNDRRLRLWERGIGMPVTTLRGHTSHIRQVEFVHDGTWLTSIGDDGGLRFWDIRRDTQLSMRGLFIEFGAERLFGLTEQQLGCEGLSDKVSGWSIVEPEGFLSMAQSNDGRSVFGALQNGQLKRYAGGDRGESVAELESGADALLVSNSNVLFAGQRNGTVTRLDFETGTRVDSEDFGSPIRLLREIPSTNQILGAFFSGNEFFVLDADSLKLIHRVKGGAELLGMDVHPDGATIATSHRDGSIRVWTLGAVVREVSSFGSGSNWLNCVAFSPDGRRLVVGGENVISVWNHESRKEILSISTSRCVHFIRFSRDGQRMAVSGEDPRIRSWRVCP